VLRIFITHKNPFTSAGIEPATLGPVASTLTTSPPRQIRYHKLHKFFFPMAQQLYSGVGRLNVEVSRSHTIRHTSLGRTSLEERSARRRDLYLTTHKIHKRKTSMPPTGFETVIPASELPQNYALTARPPGSAEQLVAERKLFRNPLCTLFTESRDTACWISVSLSTYTIIYNTYCVWLLQGRFKVRCTIVRVIRSNACVSIKLAARGQYLNHGNISHVSAYSYISIADITSYSYFIEMRASIPLKCWQPCS
jgi:hypothetical protein